MSNGESRLPNASVPGGGWQAHPDTTYKDAQQ